MTDLTAKRIKELRALQSLWEPISAAAAKELKLSTMPDLLDCPDDIGQTSSGAHRLAHLVVQWDVEKRRADRLAEALRGLLPYAEKVIHSTDDAHDRDYLNAASAALADEVKADG